jgi:hypothetical protein
MRWAPLPKLSKSIESYLKSLRKVRLYADEDVEAEVVAMIRDRGVNIASVHERNEQGKSDETHLATAKREHRFLLTKDKDFLDDARFPLRWEGTGIIYLHGSFKAEQQYLDAIANLLNYIVPYSQIYQGAKIQIAEKSMTFRYVDYKGQIRLDQVVLRPDGDYVKVDDVETERNR